MSIDIKIESAKTLKPKPSTHDLGFGKYFTDHMFIADFSEAKGWFDPRIVAYQSLSLDPGASVLHYGQALFEGMKAFKGVDGKIRLFRPEMNWKRLQEGAARLCMKAPNWDLFFQGILNFVKIEETWIPTEPTTSLYLRPTLIGTEAFLGVRPSEQYLFYIIGSPVGAYYSQPDLGAQAVKIWVEMNDSRCAPGGIGAVKAGGNYASSLRAATAARKQGYAQVLWLDAGEKKYIEEVGTMNVFFKIADEVITPPLSGTILPGVMRNSIIELMNS
ncbi:MAG: branched-chain amino acid aminotransferase, partial [Pseudobdellovibrionaceae bacterium]